jgi:hypothetical protein
VVRFCFQTPGNSIPAILAISQNLLWPVTCDHRMNRKRGENEKDFVADQWDEGEYA